MKRKTQVIILMTLLALVPRADAQTSQFESLFRDVATMDAGTQNVQNEADPVLERFVQSNRENVVATLPVILHATSDTHLSVRRVAASAIYQISTRSDGQAILSDQTTTFTALLVDPDLPIRRISMLAVATLRPNASTPIMPFLRAYLAREDAARTIGSFVAAVLIQAAPDDVKGTDAIVRFMQRTDQTLENEEDLLNAIMRNRAGPYNRDIAREVARYAGGSDEQISVRAIGTLQGMGKSAISDYQQSLSRIAADAGRPLSVRTAATRALAVVQ